MEMIERKHKFKVDKEIPNGLYYSLIILYFICYAAFKFNINNNPRGQLG